MQRAVASILPCVLVGGLALGGCKAKPPANTPEAVAQAFAEAMAKGDTEAAAELWDYTTEARKANPDWDEIVPGQKAQIIPKMKPAKAEELQARTGLFAPGMKAGSPTTSGSTATVQCEGGPQGAVLVVLAQSDGKWGVTEFSPAGAR